MPDDDRETVGGLSYNRAEARLVASTTDWTGERGTFLLQQFEKPFCAIHVNEETGERDGFVVLTDESARELYRRLEAHYSDENVLFATLKD